MPLVLRYCGVPLLTVPAGPTLSCRCPTPHLGSQRCIPDSCRYRVSLDTLGTRKRLHRSRSARWFCFHPLPHTSVKCIVYSAFPLLAGSAYQLRTYFANALFGLTVYTNGWCLGSPRYRGCYSKYAGAVQNWWNMYLPKLTPWHASDSTLGIQCAARVARCGSDASAPSAFRC